ncbi:hypothetical protein BD413DRAFT_231958 [Trametes elegans]|nr:hypothetical protein BD413DRAFT_231958 [Trametes elegans]
MNTMNVPPAYAARPGRAMHRYRSQESCMRTSSPVSSVIRSASRFVNGAPVRSRRYQAPDIPHYTQSPPQPSTSRTPPSSPAGPVGFRTHRCEPSESSQRRANIQKVRVRGERLSLDGRRIIDEAPAVEEMESKPRSLPSCFMGSSWRALRQA